MKKKADKTAKEGLVPVKTVKAEKVKDSCIYCFESLPPETRKDKKSPNHLNGFDDLCEGHQKALLKPFSEEDKKIAVDIINMFGNTMKPMAKIFLTNVPFLVQDKKERDKEFAKKEKELKAYMDKLRKDIAERTAKEEAIRAELEKKGLLKKDEDEKPKRKRRSRLDSKEKPKKLSEAASEIKESGLLPSQIMAIASGGTDDPVGVQEAVQSDTPKDEPRKSRRGRKPKQS